mmetsp:Transcript_6531/g.9604  ORF Transcript_6531/g.9604 Transcript_6531/m.9604 type:complete len:122 (-) Transcript_6531:1382-1747(-)
MKALDVASLLLVGALWGCTNPWLRQGSEQASSSQSILKKILNVRVWLPYVINQAGSLVYYLSLRNSNLTMAVPICNGLALVFSCGTSYLLGETVDKPLQAIFGATFVTMGVGLCMLSAQNE